MVIELDLKTIFLVLGDVYEFIPEDERKSHVGCYEYEREGCPVLLLPLKILNTIDSLPIINYGRSDTTLFLVRVGESKIYLITTNDPKRINSTFRNSIGECPNISVWRAFYSDSITDAKGKLIWQIGRSSSGV